MPGVRAQELALSDDDRRQVARWSAVCAERVLPLYESRTFGDARARDAIAGTWSYVHGAARSAHLRTLGWDAYRAARDAADPVSCAAAHAASLAAAAAYMHALASPHQVKHALGSAAQHALARELEAGDPAVGDESILWALEHVPPEVRALVRRMPGPKPSRTRLSQLIERLDTTLRS